MCTFLATGLLLCSGALGYAGPLDAVAERRYAAAWGGLADDPAGYAVLVGLRDCSLIGRRGWLLAGERIYAALIADCSQASHSWPAGYLADVSRRGLGTGWVVLR